MPAVVDENVLVVANDLTRLSLGLDPIATHVDESCRIAAMDFIDKLIKSGSLLVDDGGEFLEKYKSHCSFSGQPGIGDAFLRLMFESGHQAGWVTRVSIRNGDEYKLPAHFIASGFDNDDFLWVAAAYNGPAGSFIANACDSDYANHALTIDGIGVKVVEICA